MRQTLITILLLMASLTASAEQTRNPQAAVDLLQRVANIDENQLVTILDTDLSGETFVLGAEDGKPMVTASTMSALTAGINWYLNHYARVNISWNNLTTDLSAASLPLPDNEESHTASVDYRYYLNYCTFSYSMSTWTWERWEQEIDWMALHGINMPLQIIGLEVVWRNLLTKHYGYTDDEANDFVAGPCFQAWFGMNNLQGWGGPNPSWWYDRQQTLASRILSRERELGIEPVLPGFSGMVPSDFESKTGIAAEAQGNWCGFQRPYILDPSSSDFATVAANYYAELDSVMGQSLYYSMDPFHEGGTIASGKYAEGYTAIFDAMEANCGSDTKWIIQQWQWSSNQKTSLTAVPEGRLLVLDLFSDGNPGFNSYSGYSPQVALYCTIPNFGGRSGFMGRLDKQMTEFFSYKAKYSTINGIGATPEAIGQVPVLYDNLYELPWMDTAPESAEAWLADYTEARYGQADSLAQMAWEQLRTSALNCQTSLQGPHEAVYCARPSLSVNAVSSWGGTSIFYDPQDVANAAYRLLEANIDHPNYNFDLLEVGRQMLSDYAKELLAGISEASGDTSGDDFVNRRDAFLALILDIDSLLGTDQNFRLGNWTEMARGMADEAEGTTDSDRDWLELDNARTIISTWGDYSASESGGLRDYSYRAWQGMLKDYYYTRWRYWFKNGMSAPTGGWFYHDWEWAHNLVMDYTTAAISTRTFTRTYTAEPEGDTRTYAQRIMPRYVLPLTLADGSRYYIYRVLSTSLPAESSLQAIRGRLFEMPVDATDSIGFTLLADLNSDGDFDDEGESSEGLSFSLPSDAPLNLAMRLTHTDGTVFDFTLTLTDVVDNPRTITLHSADETAGSVSIDGSDQTSISTTESVALTATPSDGYRFTQWTYEDGSLASTDNPLTYSLAPDVELWAQFEWFPWTIPSQDESDMSTIQSYAQYVNSFRASVAGGSYDTIYVVSSCPSTLYQETDTIVATAGDRVRIAWSGNDGLSYCYLSAYLDSDSNGSFDTVLGTKGTASSQNSSVASGTISFYAPDMEGVTRARFRFDSAWRLPTDADYSTTRFVYDIPIRIEAATVEDGIASIPQTNADATIYDLQGRKATNNAPRGIYIINGEKKVKD